MRHFSNAFMSIAFGLSAMYCAFSSAISTAMAYPASAQKAVSSTEEPTSQKEPTLTVKPVKSWLKRLPTTTITWAPHSQLTTPWGLVNVSAKGITHVPIQVTLTKGNINRVIYTFAQLGGKNLVSGQVDGHYLLLNFGLTGNAQPTTGDYGGYYAVVDLRTAETVTSGLTGQGSGTIISLSPNYLVVRNSAVTGVGYSHEIFTYEIINLTTRQHVTMDMIDNDPFGDEWYVSQNRIFFHVQKPATGIYDVSIPKSAWSPLTVQKLYRLVIE